MSNNGYSDRCFTRIYTWNFGGYYRADVTPNTRVGGYTCVGDVFDG